MTFGIQRSACIVGPSGETLFTTVSITAADGGSPHPGASENPLPPTSEMGRRTDFPADSPFRLLGHVAKLVTIGTMDLQNLSLGEATSSIVRSTVFDWNHGDIFAPRSETGLTNFAMGAFYQMDETGATCRTPDAEGPARRRRSPALGADL